MKIKKAEAEHTGGGIWMFYGWLEDGNYFIVDEDGEVKIFDKDSYNATYYEYDKWLRWCKKHLVKEPEGKEREQFCSEMLDKLEKSDNRGGIFLEEIEGYRRRWLGSDEQM